MANGATKEDAEEEYKGNLLFTGCTDFSVVSNANDRDLLSLSLSLSLCACEPSWTNEVF